MTITQYIHHLTKYAHCAIELKFSQKIITVYASVHSMYNSVTTNTYDSTEGAIVECV